LVTALHSLGTLLALGLFTLPAVSASLWCERWHHMLITSVCFAVSGAVTGMLVSLSLGAPSGACVVACLGGIFALSCLVSPNGLLSRGRRHRHAREDADEACDVKG
jgi:ABC-type Mn2+/Zn2+ transport system permease subunit